MQFRGAGRARFDDGDDGRIETQSIAYQRIVRELLAAVHGAG